MFDDPVDNIALGGRAMFARSKHMTCERWASPTSPPMDPRHMYTDDKVDVVVPDIAESLVRGSDLA